ncbi:DUF2487 family protein [Paenibacillus typhae]|uniref:DUF2487 family protein n=1 Tax=Paenibacillus typhae TaxID=1174501 RepID=A0A1G9G1M5_9BACL|nr:DUF2487 family protein [Paenibacillus typhae]SDK94536.1 Protein of unknown function [Paenibacillus typhae]
MIKLKFSEFTEESWNEHGKYFDTCLLPFTGLSGEESPPEAAAVLEKLRDLLELIEKPFRGRIVVYPAIQYATGQNADYFNEVCRKVKSSIFQYVIVASAVPGMSAEDIYESDLVFALSGFGPVCKGPEKSEINEKIHALWQSVT